LNSKKGAGNFLLDLFFPNRCPFCDEFIPWNKFACDKCYSEILWTDEYVCKKCGKDSCICDTGLNYDLCYTAAYYKGNVKEAILGLKVKNALNFADIAAEVICYKMAIDGVDKKIDYIVPVPMTKEKQRLRGYNQAQEFGRSISRIIKASVRTDILFKNDSDVDQHELSAEERKENVKNLYYFKYNDEITGKTILLCDDVLTTGSTADKCSELLKECGAETVIVAAAATTSLIL
jgi:competence protein ComFC